MHENIVICATDLSTPLPYVRTLNTRASWNPGTRRVEVKHVFRVLRPQFSTVPPDFWSILSPHRISCDDFPITILAILIIPFIWSWNWWSWLWSSISNMCCPVCFQTSLGVGVDGRICVFLRKTNYYSKTKGAHIKWLATDVGMFELNDPLSP